MNEVPAPVPPRSLPPRSLPPRRGRYLGPVKITLPLVVVLLTLIVSLIFDAYVVAAVSDQQIPLLAIGLAVTGISFSALAVGALVGMWRAASRAAGGRSFALALVGGLAGLAALGAFAVTAVLMLLARS